MRDQKTFKRNLNKAAARGFGGELPPSFGGHSKPERASLATAQAAGWRLTDLTDSRSLGSRQSPRPGGTQPNDKELTKESQGRAATTLWRSWRKATRWKMVGPSQLRKGAL